MTLAPLGIIYIDTVITEWTELMNSPMSTAALWESTHYPLGIQTCSLLGNSSAAAAVPLPHTLCETLESNGSCNELNNTAEPSEAFTTVVALTQAKY